MDEPLSRQLIDQTPPEKIVPSQAMSPGYESTPAGLVWCRPTRDAVVDTPLTNFDARIVVDTVVDNGLELHRIFTIRAELGGEITTFEIPASRFAAMAWHTEHLGAEALVLPGLVIREHARAAIQFLSMGQVEKELVFAHLGWRQHDGQWIYLHVDGAIGASGSVKDLKVQLEDNLMRYRLPDPPTHQACIDAIQRSMRFLELAPEVLTVPLYAAVWRAVLGEGDFSIHLAGPTGQGKSAIAALVQQHFGATMEARYLPANWTSSANSLEAIAFAAKDAVLVVDEFTAADARHAQELQRAGERLFRSQANRAGRQRMRPDASLRLPKPPRGLILSTGEDGPRGQSLQARMLLIDVEPGAIDFAKLTICQEDALAGYYSQALAAFIQWLAPHYHEIQTHWQAELAELRQAAAQDRQHRRTAGNIASLALGWRYFLIFAQQVGALTEEQAQAWWKRAWETLQHLAGTQDLHQAEAEPAQRFLDLLQDALASGRAHLKQMGMLDSVECKGERIGWIEGDRVYLLPDVAYAVAKRLGVESGNELTVTAPTLHKRLHEKGLIADIEASRTTLLGRKQIDGQRHRVLVVFSRALSRGKKHDQHDHSPLNSPEWSCFCPPLTSQWSCFLPKHDHNSPFNYKDLSESGHVGHVFAGDRRLEAQNMPESGHVSPKKHDHSISKHDHSISKHDHFPSAHLLVEGEQACSRCGMPMEEAQPEGPAELKWQCSTCGWWLIHCK
jgi:hypothetical protein